MWKPTWASSKEARINHTIMQTVYGKPSKQLLSKSLWDFKAEGREPYLHTFDS